MQLSSRRCCPARESGPQPPVLERGHSGSQSAPLTAPPGCCGFPSRERGSQVSVPEGRHSRRQFVVGCALLAGAGSPGQEGGALPSVPPPQNQLDTATMKLCLESAQDLLMNTSPRW